MFALIHLLIVTTVGTYCKESTVSSILTSDAMWPGWQLWHSDYGQIQPDDRCKDFETICTNKVIFDGLNKGTSFSFSIYQPKGIIINNSLLHEKGNSSTNWMHYSLLNNGSYTIIYENNVPIRYEYPRNEIMVENLFFTKWKFHNYKLRVATNISSTSTTLSLSTFRCVKLYVNLCSHCILNVHYSGKEQKIVGKEEDVNGLWTTQVLTLVNQTAFSIFRNTINRDYSGFWAVDLQPCRTESKIYFNEYSAIRTISPEDDYFEIKNLTCKTTNEALEIRWNRLDKDIDSCVTRFCVTWQDENKTEPQKYRCVGPSAISVQIPVPFCDYKIEVYAEIEGNRNGTKSSLNVLPRLVQLRNLSYTTTNKFIQISWAHFHENIQLCITQYCATWLNENKTELRGLHCVGPLASSIQIPITLYGQYNVEVYAEFKGNILYGMKSRLNYTIADRIQPCVSSESVHIATFSTIVSLMSLGIFILSCLLYCKNKRQKRNSINQDVPKSEEHTILLNETNATSINAEHFITSLRKEFYSNLSGQFQSLSELEYIFPCCVGSLPDNSNKNRDPKRYLPYDCNRIILREMPGMGKDDYINASYINGFNRPKAYIAAQGPKYSTVKDFWRMIWQEDVQVIVMATGLMEQERMCAEYWPQRLEGLFECGLIMIKLVKEHVYEHYTYRQLELFYDKCVKTVEQFHLNWECGVFESDKILPVVIQLRRSYEMSTGPILIHSRYGVGRTGTLILCDLALQMAVHEQRIDFYNLTARLRNQRISMVKDLEHYILAHFIVNEFFLDKTSQFPKNLPFSTNTIVKQLEYLQILNDHDERLKELVTKTVTPWETIFPTTLVNRYGNRHFILAQTPTEDQMPAFWKVIAEKKFRHMMLLNKIFKVQPYRHDGPQEILMILVLKTTPTTFWKVVDITLLIFESESKKITYEQKISVFQFDHWKSEKLTPNLVGETIKMIEAFNSLTKDDQLVLVSCWDGTTACGLFVVLSYAYEKYVLESEIDVCGAVRIARKSGKRFVMDPKQLKFVYKFLSEYIQNNESYQIL